MGTRNTLTKLLAVAGTVLVWLPIAATLLTGAVGSFLLRRLLVDYLMPGELFPAVFIGGLLLLWAALRMRSRRALIGGIFGAAIGLLFGSQALAVFTGLASGETPPTGWPFVLVLALFSLYIASVVALGIAGAMLWRDVFRRHDQAPPPEELAPTS